jgi:dTDP-4-dehydrorhamnose 3,5-epimerase-like enzyme
MTTNREYSSLVDAGRYPEQVAVPLDAPFVNQNGTIQNLLLERFTSAALISSVRGAIRANHYHKTDWHYSYVVSGVIEYFWRPVGSRDRPKHARFPAGTMFFSPPMVEHAMFFPEESAFVTFAKNIRDHEHHEDDVVRVDLVRADADPAAEGGWSFRFPSSP